MLSGIKSHFKVIQKIFLLLVFTHLSLCLPEAAGAENEYFSQKRINYYESTARGDFVYLGMRVTLKGAYHINANPPSEDYLIPTTLKLPPSEDYRVIGYRYPAPKELNLSFADKPVAVYSGTFVLYAKIKLNKAAEGVQPVKLQFEYQACDDVACYQPVKEEFAVDLQSIYEASTGKSRPDWIAEDQPLGGGGSKGGLQRTLNLSEGGLWIPIVFAIIGGLILNVMPCVFPVISIKILSLMQIASSDRRSFVKSNLFFVAGIFTTFMVIALIIIALKTSGEFIGWGFQFQNPAFLFFMIVLIFALSLSLLGVFTIALPGFSGTLSGSVASYQGHFKPFFEGALVTILATPCTAPFLGAALGFAFTQPPLIVLLIFESIAFGMALPFCLLALFPQSARFIPRPGAWMETVKRVMALPLLATVVWLFSVLASVSGTGAVISGIVFLTVAGTVFWVLKKIKKKYAMFSGTVIAAGLYLFFLHPQLMSTSPGITGHSLSEKFGVKWEAFSEEKLNSLLKTDEIIFIDFTAKWCLTCQWNKKNVLHKKDTAEKFRAHNVRVLVADWTANDPVITKYIQAYGRAGVPVYVVYSRDKSKKPAVLPEILTKKILFEAIDKAAE